MQDGIAVKVENLSKVYKLYNSPIDRLKESLHPLRKRYHNDYYAINNVSFEIKKGDSVGIIGKNGSGKSTLLKILTGVLTPTRGTVTVNGKVSALLELGAGFNPELTGIENIYFNGMLMGYTREEMDERLDNILSFTDIGEFVQQPVKTYSSGMFVRLAFAVAINVEPEILIVDEALSVGDEAFQRKCFARIIGFKKRGKTILFVSHSTATILELTNKAILLNDGELLIEDNPKKVTSIYQKMINMSKENMQMFMEQLNITYNQGNDANTVKSTIDDIKYNLVAFLDQNMSSKSCISYEKRGAEIFNTIISKEDGSAVNMLVRGATYYYSYSVKFDVSAFNLRFGMLIKTTNGLEIAGMLSHTPANGLECVKKGQIVNVKFKFRCSLLPGAYFLNSGVAGTVDNEEIFLHRVIDVLMFKVQSEPEIFVTGIADISVNNCDTEITISE